MGAPSTSARGLDDAPGHGDSTATDDHADRQEREALPQRRGVHGEGELTAGGGGPGHHPAEQRGKTQGHLQTAPLATPFGAALVPGISIPVAEAFAERVAFDGVVLTKLDGDARGGAALSVKAVTGKPIKLVSVGEQLDQLEYFHPDRMAQRILGMGYVLSLIEKAEAAVEDEGELRRIDEPDPLRVRDRAARTVVGGSANNWLIGSPGRKE